nr:hypothetical protein [Tanacetum cinerariifolium]
MSYASYDLSSPLVTKVKASNIACLKPVTVTNIIVDVLSIIFRVRQIGIRAFGYREVEEEDDEEEKEEEEEEEEKEESKKKESKEVSEMGSNSESPGYASFDNKAESDLESTTKNEPKCKEMEDTCEKMAPNRRSGSRNDENPDIAAIIAQQLQNILPQIVTQVTNNVNNTNANGGAVALTRWIEKMESVIENSGCSVNQKVKGREAAMGITWVDFKALLV